MASGEQRTAESIRETAREEAVQHIRRTLGTLEELDRVDSLLESRRTQLAGAQTKVATALQHQVKGVREGRDALQDARNAVNCVQEGFRAVDSLCKSGSQLGEREDLVTQLGRSKTNLSKVIDVVESIFSLPTDASKLLQAISHWDSSEHDLVATWEQLTELELRAGRAKATLNQARQKHGTSGLASYFDAIHNASQRFDSILWHELREDLFKGSEGTKMMTDIAFVVEGQEELENRIGLKKRSGSHEEHERPSQPEASTLLARHVQPKEFRQKCQQEIRSGVSFHFSECFSKSAELGKGSTVSSVLEKASELVADLANVFDFIDPCFPKETRVFHHFMEALHDQVAHLFDEFYARCSLLSNNEILEIAKWHSFYLDQMRSLGMEESSITLPGLMMDPAAIEAEGGSPGEKSVKSLSANNDNEAWQTTSLDQFLLSESYHPGNNSKSSKTQTAQTGIGLSHLLDAYTVKVEKTIKDWIKNIVESDTKKEPKESEDGYIRLPGVLDFFWVLNEQLALLRTETCPDLPHRFSISVTTCASRLCGVFLSSVENFLSGERSALLKHNVDLMKTCAGVNSSSLGEQKTKELYENVCQIIPVQFQGGLETSFERLQTDFLCLARELNERAALMVLDDEGVKTILKRLFVHESWRSGEAISTLVATLEDYFNDLIKYLEPSFFKRLSEIVLQECVERYSTAFLQGRCTLTPEVLKRMEADEQALSKFFTKMARPTKVDRQIRRICNLRNLARSTSAEEFVMSFSVAMSNDPNTNLDVADGVISMREDIGKQEKKELLNQCKEVLDASNQSY